MSCTPSTGEKAKKYVDEELITQEMAERVIRCIDAERGEEALINEEAQEAGAAPAEAADPLATRLNPEQLKAALATRVEQMMRGQVRDDGSQEEGVTDQYRVYVFIIEALQREEPLRLLVQASAGTGTHVAQRACSRLTARSIASILSHPA